MLGAAPARAGDDAAVFAVAYIDVTPSAQTNATRLLRQERALGRKDDGNLRFDVFMEVARPTRFLLLSVWRDPKAAEAHAAADHTKQFRAALDAIRVTPFATHVLTLLAGDQVTGPTGRPAAGTAAIYVVTHFDSIPPFKDEAAGALKQLAEASRKESGAVQYQALQQTNRPNHFKLIEVWKDQSAYNAHVAAAHTKQFSRFRAAGRRQPLRRAALQADRLS
ncbi:MAG: antibiotic biosynthesis monooxygenase [Pseudomonadota bacterium]